MSGDYISRIYSGTASVLTKVTLKDNLPLVDTKWFVGVGVEWELFNGFQREHKINASKYKIQQVEEFDKQARLNLDTYTEKLYNTMQKELEQYESLNADELFAKKLKFMRTRAFEEGTGTYTTPAGGFATAANVNEIFANINSQVDGFADSYNGKYVVLENTDMVGLYQAGATNGFTFADNVLNNGRVGQWMGVDIYVVRTGTFTDATVGTKTWTNAGHRVAGVKNVSTTALPGGTKTEEKMVSGKTGMEVATYGYVGFKLWAPKVTLTIDITLA